MRPCDVDAILRAEGSAQIPFSYRKGDYALQLLLLGIGGGRQLCALRESRFARLFDKPEVRAVLARVGTGVLTPAALSRALQGEREIFSVTLGRWGSAEARDWNSGYFQTSRPGQNLVVQINFPPAHDEAYRALVEPGEDHPFLYPGHPVRVGEPFTLAWVRLDVDVEAREALIEEVQSDWVRAARHVGALADEWLESGEPAGIPFVSNIRGPARAVQTYIERVLSPYAKLWAECALSAAIAFAYERLAITKLYFHSYEGGLLMKRLGAWGPPRSLYTDLPKQFCFQETQRAPHALRTDRRVRERQPTWFELELV